jgi:hypothetical protein
MIAFKYSCVFSNYHISKRVITIAAYTISCFKPGTNVLFTKQELELRHDLTIGLELYIELRFIINSAFQRLGLNSGKIPILEYPQQPILINVATMCKKGCGTYYKMLNKKKCLKGKYGLGKVVLI